MLDIPEDAQDSSQKAEEELPANVTEEVKTGDVDASVVEEETKAEDDTAKGTEKNGLANVLDLSIFKEYFTSRGVVLFLTKHLNMTFPIVKISLLAAWESIR